MPAFRPTFMRVHPMRLQNECPQKAGCSHLAPYALDCFGAIRVPHRRKAAWSPFCEFIFFAASARSADIAARAKLNMLRREIRAVIRVLIGGKAAIRVQTAGQMVRSH